MDMYAYQKSYEKWWHGKLVGSSHSSTPSGREVKCPAIGPQSGVYNTKLRDPRRKWMLSAKGNDA
jgi:hypothetical protein